MPGSGIAHLRLEVRDFTDLTRWRWTLTGENGVFLADHEVRLDPSTERFEAFTALHDYVSWHAAPDKRQAEEARIVTGLGDWIGTEVLGDAIGAALVARRPATVEAVLPEGAAALAYLPLEAARVQGRSLVGHDITLVIRPQADGAARTGRSPSTAPSSQSVPRVSGRLRVLGLFSLPDGRSALNLRRERQSLVDLIRGIAASGRAADIRVLQYGVTRDRLRDVLEEADGWDIIHVSGHGTPGELVLETAAGTPDLISAGDIADLLDTARDHVRLITLSACWSASLTVTEQRRLLGLPSKEDQHHDHAERPEPSPPGRATAPGTLATTLASRLGCAVLAMRFPVGDEFSIALAAKLYDLLARQGQPLPRAVGLTLSHLTYHSGRRFPALSMAAPAIFGLTATGLTLKAPGRSGPVSYATENLKMAGFPPQPDRFVGRTAVMARASAALAADSRVPGVLLHGMPGGGKTACALELAYTHEHAFDRLVWFRAPDESTAINGALTDFALTLERDLPGFQMIHVLADDTKLTAFLPALTELLERSRLLIVIDNAESLLTDTGQWRNEQWARVLAALTGHNGLGRVIMTTRLVPAETPTLQVEAVNALSLDEALLLARELPSLRKLMDGGLPAIDPATSRKLASGVINATQGHPKLLELADGQAADPDRLAALIAAGDQAWSDQGGLPEGFFDTGETAAAPSGYLHLLGAWTAAVTGTFTVAERDLFWLLCCLEESDRIRPVLDSLWGYFCRSREDVESAPSIDRTLAASVSSALATIRAETDNEDESYTIHPGVAAAGRSRAGDQSQATVDRGMAEYWETVYQRTSAEEQDHDFLTAAVRFRACLAAVPYLIRLEEWHDAAYLIEQGFAWEPSRANAAAVVLPAIRQISRHYPPAAGLLAWVLQALDPAAAEAQLRTLLDGAVAQRDYRAASSVAGDLTNLYREQGRLPKALALARRGKSYARRADLDPWSPLFHEARRLQVLNAMGRARQVLSEVRVFLMYLDPVPVPEDPAEARISWEIRDLFLDTGREAARLLGRHEDALLLNADRIMNMGKRGATLNDVRQAQFNDYGPLLSLGRADEALDLLLECRRAFQQAGDLHLLGAVFGALADTEDRRGHGEAAIRLQRDALRYAHLAGDAISIANGFHNLGNHLASHRHKPAAVASHLAAALIFTLAGIRGTGPEASPGGGSAAASIRAVAVDLRAFGGDAELAANVADLCHMINDISGTDPARLIERLSSSPGAAEQALRDLITQARALSEALPQNPDTA